jgi:hypothetical protein
VGRIKDHRIASIEAFRVLVEESRFNYIISPQYKFKSRWDNFKDLDNRPLREYVAIPKVHGLTIEFESPVEHRVSNRVSECRKWLEDYKKRNGCQAPIIELKAEESQRKAPETPKKVKAPIRCSVCTRKMRMGTSKMRSKEIICISCRIEKEMRDYQGGDKFFTDGA